MILGIAIAVLTPLATATTVNVEGQSIIEPTGLAVSRSAIYVTLNHQQVVKLTPTFRLLGSNLVGSEKAGGSLEVGADGPLLSGFEGVYRWGSQLTAVVRTPRIGTSYISQGGYGLAVTESDTSHRLFHRNEAGKFVRLKRTITSLQMFAANRRHMVALGVRDKSQIYLLNARTGAEAAVPLDRMRSAFVWEGLLLSADHAYLLLSDRVLVYSLANFGIKPVTFTSKSEFVRSICDTRIDSSGAVRFIGTGDDDSFLVLGTLGKDRLTTIRVPIHEGGAAIGRFDGDSIVVATRLGIGRVFPGLGGPTTWVPWKDVFSGASNVDDSYYLTAHSRPASERMVGQVPKNVKLTSTAVQSPSIEEK